MGTESWVLLCGGETPLIPTTAETEVEEPGRTEATAEGGGGSFNGLMPSSGISSNPVIWFGVILLILEYILHKLLLQILFGTKSLSSTVTACILYAEFANKNWFPPPSFYTDETSEK